MKKAYSYFAILGLAAASLSSCSRANYAANTTSPVVPVSSVAQAPVSPAADMSATVTAAPRPAEMSVAPAPAPEVAAPVAVAAPKAVAVAPSPVATAPVVAAAPATATEPAAIAAELTPAKQAKLTLMQRLVLKKVTKQLAKAQARGENTAGVAHTAAHAPGVTVGLIGLAALIVGIIVSSGFLIVAGAIVLVVGIVLYAIA